MIKLLIRESFALPLCIILLAGSMAMTGERL